MIRQIFKFGLNRLSEEKKIRLFEVIRSTLPNMFVRPNMFQHINLLKQIGFEPDFVVDVGAYRGDWTKETLKIYPNAKFLMVEAQPSKLKVLTAIANSFENIYFENVLLGEVVRENVKFYDMETGSSIYEENTAVNRKVSYLNMKTLDMLPTINKLDGKGFIKLDVQGAEIDILKGAKNTLGKTEFILLEASTLNYNQKAPLAGEVIKFLDEIGFSLFDICDERRKADNVLFQVDLIFIKKQSPFYKKIDFSREKLVQ